MTKYPFVIVFCMDFADRFMWKAVQAMTLEDAVGGRIRHEGCMIANQVSRDAFGSELVLDW